VKKAAIFLCYAIAAVCMVVVVGVGCVLTTLYTGTLPPESDVGNCWSHEIPKWLVNGPWLTYIVIRLSRGRTRGGRETRILWPHVFFARSISDLSVEEFKPVRRLPGWKGYFGAVWFRGRVRMGRGEEQS
jgi:hypothetical protein